MTKYKVVSGDSHLEISPGRWSDRVPAKYKERAPRLVTLPHGGDGIIIEGREVYTLGLAITGAPPEEHKLFGLNYEGAPGAGTPERRLQEQDRDGVDAEVLYTSAGNARFWRGIGDDDAYNAVIHAYNEFLAEEYQAAAPTRLLPAAVIPQSTIEASMAELEYAISKNMNAIMLSTYPSGKGYPTDADDRFWQLALDAKMAVTAHVNFNGREGPYYQYAKTPNLAAFGANPVRALGRFAQGEHVAVMISMMLHGVFDRFPALNIYWAETMIGWLPSWLEQLDDTYRRNRHWMERDFGLDPLVRKPSEYILDNATWGFIYDPFGVKMRNELKIENLIWGSDFPHSASDWPNSGPLLDMMFDGASAEDRSKLICDNAVKFFHLTEK
jgi:predicted TIM-barrel fold metal-dependent hydrolase